MVIDACGIGSMPDWEKYDEVAPSNTLANTCKYAHENMGGIKLPNLQKLGIANIVDLPGLNSVENPLASYGKMSELNDAKDTITGHWEMVGVQSHKPFPYYPNGFPKEIIEKFKKETGVYGVLGNCAASGTQIINELGDEHMQTGFPIIYTSADSVLQIACHVDKVDLDTQYKWCNIAREIMRGEHEVARIIARPFTTSSSHIEGQTAKYVRLNDKRHDYSIPPHTRSILDTVLADGGEVLGLGKIQDIFAKVGVPKNIHTKDNADGLVHFKKVLKKQHTDFKSQAENQVIFINLVETDCNYGHRRDPKGFAHALEEIDKEIPEIISSLGENDIFFITADHGCDPCAAGTDHTREYVPLLIYNKNISSRSLGTRKTFADISATISDWFGLMDPNLGIKGESCLV